MDFIRKHFFSLSVIGLALALAFICLGDIKEFRPDDESLYVHIAREMYQKGEAWVPTWLGEHAFYKPPLAYWVSMAGFLVAGTSIAAARIPVALLSLLTLYLLYLMGRDLFDRRTGLIAVLIGASSMGFITHQKMAMMDMPLCFFITLPMYYFHKAQKDGSPLAILLFFAASGVSTLIKGPISFIVIMAAAGAYCLCTKTWKPFINVWSAAGILLALLAIALWPLALYFKGCFSEWVSFFIIRENFGKFHDIHYPWYLILTALLLFLIPWSPLFISGLWSFITKKLYKERSFLFIFLWLASILVIHMLPATKLKHYAVPALPPAALFIAAVAARCWNDRAFIAGRIVTAAGLCICALSFAALTRVIPGTGNQILCALGSAFILYSLIALIRRQDSAASAAAFCAALLFILPGLSSLTYERLPSRALPLLQEKDTAVVNLQTYVYTHDLNKYTPQINATGDFNAFLIKGGRVIVSETNIKRFASDREIRIVPLRRLMEWTEWKESVPAGAVLEALWKGDISGLLDRTSIVEWDKED